MSSLKRLVAHAAVAGERERGSDGVVFIRKVEGNSVVTWIKLNEVAPAELQDKLEDLLTEEGGLYVFVVQMEDDNNKVHLWKMTRAEILSVDSEHAAEDAENALI